MTLKFNQFAPGGPIVNGDKVVGLRGGVSTIFDAQAAAASLLKSNNLSDVANVDTSRTNLSAPKTSSGIGSPQGVVAGSLGDMYIDTSAPTDKFYVCIVAGTALTATWQVQTNLSGALLAANNLSDVANSATSLSNIGGQKKTIVGSGDPNGSQAGTIGDTFYFDTTAVQLWICTQTGTSSTAVWAIQNQQGGGIDTVNLGFTTTQMLSNKLYIGTNASPSPAIGIMPVSPTPGDMIIIYAAATAGVTIQIGTASIINVTNNLVSSTIFVPFRNTLVLRCSNSASGGQWFSESIDDTVIIDGTTTVGYQPLNIVGSGDPNGSQAGVQGVNFYYDTSTNRMWNCSQTGTSSTAVWELQSEEGIETLDLNSITPQQMFTNKLYIGVIASPSPAIGIMPIAPKAGDMIIIYAAATAGITIQKGTASIINITNNLVTSSLFIPFRNTVVLRCSNPASGGQWFSESIDDTVIIDGTTTVGYQPLNITGTGNPNGTQAGIAGINFYSDLNPSNPQLWRCVTTGSSSTAVWDLVTQESNVLPGNIIYFTSATVGGIPVGSDTNGNGSQSFPFATYNFAAAYAAGLATATNQYAVFPMGQEDNGSSDIVLYPFVNITGSNFETNSIHTTGSIVKDSTFDSISTPKFLGNNVGLIADSGINIVLSVAQGAQFVWSNCSFGSTPTLNFTGTLDNDTELFLIINCVDILNTISCTYSDCVSVFLGSSFGDVKMVSNSTLKNCILIFLNNGAPNAGSIVVQSVPGSQGAILFCVDSPMNSITIDGAQTFADIDGSSYTSNLTFLNGATFNNINLTTVGDSISLASYSPTGFTLPPSPTGYSQASSTNYIAGIDNELVSIKSPPILYACNYALPDIVIAPSGDSFLAFSAVQLDTNTAFNSTTCEYNIPKNGKYEMIYHVQTHATGTLTAHSYYVDTAFFIDGAFNNHDEYCSNRNDDVTSGITDHFHNVGSMIVHLNAGQLVKVNTVNNGNISTSIVNASLSIKYLGP